MGLVRILVNIGERVSKMPEPDIVEKPHNFLNFSPQEYLEEYYSHIGTENSALLSFFSKAYKDFDENSLKTLEIGGGPTIYQLISLAPVAKCVHFTDYLVKNLEQIKHWVKNDSRGYNWDNFILYALNIEQPGKVHDQDSILERKGLIQKKLTNFSTCNVFKDSVVDTNEGPYDLLSMNFVAESVSSDMKEFTAVLSRMSNLLVPGGVFVMSGLLKAKFWVEGGRKFPSTYLTEKDVIDLLTNIGYKIEIFDTVAAEHDKSDPENQGYEGIFMVKARMKP